MNTLDIVDYVKGHNACKIFRGVFACDDLPLKVNKPGAYIINLSKKSEAGSHWVALFIDNYNWCYYFDSFGLPPSNTYIISFIKKNTIKMLYNTKQLQHITSTKCGKFCCVFIVNILKNKSIAAFILKFSPNLYINELVIERLFQYMK